MSSSATLIYDGDCGFCERAVSWLARRSAFVALTWQGADLEKWNLSLGQVQESVWVLDGADRAAGADAFSMLLTRSHHLPWRIAGRAMGIPGGTPFCALRFEDASSLLRQPAMRPSV